MELAWTDGYITDIAYTATYISELSPTVYSMACALSGIHPPVTSGTFNYCELGCGKGITPSLLGSAFPQAKFYATDFNPSHISFADNFRKNRGIANVKFFDLPFEEFINTELPEFDIIVMHGVYSWISPVQRTHLIQFIKNKLKVGGAVYCSYNTMPGKMSMAPLRYIIKEIADHPNPIQRVEEGFKIINALAKQPVGVFHHLKSSLNAAETLQKFSKEYLVHEFLHEYWQSFYCTDVFREMRQAKLTFVGSANFSVNHEVLCIPQSHLEMYRQLSTVEQKELFKDLVGNTDFRKDIYIKGPLKASAAELKNLQKILYLGKVPFFKDFQDTCRCPIGVVDFKTDPAIKKVYDFLGGDIVSLAQIIDDLKTTLPEHKILESIRFLLASGQAAPFAAHQNYDQQPTASSNLLSLQQAVSQGESCWLASQKYGNSIHLGYQDALLMFSFIHSQDAEQIPAFGAQTLVSQGRQINVGEKQYRTVEEITEFMNDRYQEWKSKTQPELERLGII